MYRRRSRSRGRGRSRSSSRSRSPSVRRRDKSSERRRDRHDRDRDDRRDDKRRDREDRDRRGDGRSRDRSHSRSSSRSRSRSRDRNRERGREYDRYMDRGDRFRGGDGFGPPFGRFPGPGRGMGPSYDECYVCGGIGHWARNCPSKGMGRGRGMLPPVDMRMGGRGGPPPDMNPKCFECGKRGHVARECPLKTDMSASGHPIPRCYRCEGVGHIARECPNIGPDGGPRGGLENLPDRPLPPRPGPPGMERTSHWDSPPRDPPPREPLPPPRPRPEDAECFICGRPGHFARNCPDKHLGNGHPRGPPINPLSVQASAMWAAGMGIGPGMMGPGLMMGGGMPPGPPPPMGERCFECNQIGHFARECPIRQRRLKEKQEGGGRPSEREPPARRSESPKEEAGRRRHRSSSSDAESDKRHWRGRYGEKAEEVERQGGQLDRELDSYMQAKPEGARVKSQVVRTEQPAPEMGDGDDYRAVEEDRSEQPFDLNDPWEPEDAEPAKGGHEDADYRDGEDQVVVNKDEDKAADEEPAS